MADGIGKSTKGSPASSIITIVVVAAIIIVVAAIITVVDVSRGCCRASFRNTSGQKG